MHGRNKAEYASRSSAEIEALRTKVSKYRQLATLAFEKRKQGVTQDPALPLQLSGQLLRINPDVYSLWNHRKELLLHVGTLKGEEAAASQDTKVAKELQLVADCIKKNPKSYGAWHHRRWMFEQMKGSMSGGGLLQQDFTALLDRELELCSAFLDADERNFHCWNYRRFVADLHPARTHKDEFDFSTERIMKNFSNYSAFHHRTTYIQSVGKESPGGLLPLMREELELIHQAMYTEPDDQSPWWYHQFLMAWAQKDLPADEYLVLVKEEVEVVRELAESPDEVYRWAVLCLASLLQHLHAATGEGGAAQECRVTYERLATIDPDHRNRYQALLGSLR